jgi:hypothetical protein
VVRGPAGKGKGAPPRDFLELRLRLVCHVVPERAGDLQRFVVQDRRGRAFGDGAQRVLGVAWSADLAHEQQVQRCMQRQRDLHGHRNTATGKRQDDRVREFALSEHSRQQAPGGGAIGKDFVHVEQSSGGTGPWLDLDHVTGAASP